MKENKALRISFITTKQLKTRQALHIIFLKPQGKVCRGASILYFNASFSDIYSFSKMSQPTDQNQQMVLNGVVYHTSPSRIASRLTLTFIRLLTLIKGITKPCTHLHPAPSSSFQLHSAHFNLHPALCNILNNI